MRARCTPSQIPLSTRSGKVGLHYCNVGNVVRELVGHKDHQRRQSFRKIEQKTNVGDVASLLSL